INSLPVSTTLAVFTIASAASMAAVSPFVSIRPRASIFPPVEMKLYPITERLCGTCSRVAAPLSLRAVLGLLHGDLVDVGQGLGAAGAFDCFDGNILYLLLGVGQLFFERGDLSLLARHQFLEGLDAQVAHALVVFGVLPKYQGLLFEAGFRVAPGLLGSRGSFLLEAGREVGGFLAQPGEFLFLLLQRRLALFPALFQGLLLLGVLLF